MNPELQILRQFGAPGKGTNPVQNTYCVTDQTGPHVRFVSFPNLPLLLKKKANKEAGRWLTAGAKVWPTRTASPAARVQPSTSRAGALARLCGAWFADSGSVPSPGTPFPACAFARARAPAPSAPLAKERWQLFLESLPESVFIEHCLVGKLHEIEDKLAVVLNCILRPRFVPIRTELTTAEILICLPSNFL
jgi:hypothetical protein